MKTVSLAKINNVAIQLVTDNRQKLVPIRPICEALGIDHKSQLQKIKEDDFLSSTVVLSTSVGADEKDREMVCLPLEFVFGWLFTINPKNVSRKARESVSRYRIECYNALYNHFAAQSEFLSMKQEMIDKKLEIYESIRHDFNTAAKRLKTAKAELYKAKDFTFEQFAEMPKQGSLTFNLQ